MNFRQDLYDYIKSGESMTRNLGLEIEHFIVNENGLPMGFPEITGLIEQTANELGAELIYTDGHPVGYRTKEYNVTLEPACQFEISISPYEKIAKIECVYREFRELWEPLFAERGYRMVNKGLLPLVEEGRLDPGELPLSPKRRYQFMDEYFRTSGKYGRYMMRASASTQVSVDYRSEEDFALKLRVLQKIAPVLMIMMENKSRKDSVFPFPDGKPHLFRTEVWDSVDPKRSGYFPHSLEPDFGYQDVAETIYHMPLIVLTDRGESINAGQACAADLDASHLLDVDESDCARRRSLAEHFISMSFFHCRIKKFIEIRIADSVPIEKALAYVALIKGIVYTDKNLRILDRELFNINEIRKIQNASDRIRRDGAAARIYHGRTAENWAQELLRLAAEGLGQEERVYLSAFTSKGE